MVDRAQRVMNKEEQIKELNNWIKKPRDGREYQRALAVKLALEGWRYEIIASSLNVSKSFISKWKKRFEIDGTEGLKLSYQGGNSYLSESERKSVIAWLKEQEYWDISELECHLIEKYDVVFQSPTSYYSLWSEAKVSWQKAQKKNPRQNPEKVKLRSEEIQSYLRGLESEINAGEVVVYAIDEVHLLEGDLIGQGWGDRKKRLRVPIENEKNRQTYYGALDLTKSDLIMEAYPAGNGESSVDFLKKLISLNSGKRIEIFWDGAPYHKGERMRIFLESLNNKRNREDWQITCHLFAPYAPEENPIEEVWLSLKQLLRRCYRFCKNFKIMKQSFELLVKFKLFRFPNLENYNAFSCLV